MTSTMVAAGTLAAYFVFSSAVGAMAPPTKEQEAGAYGWFYRFSQILAANAQRLVAAKLPGSVGGAESGGSAQPGSYLGAGR